MPGPHSSIPAASSRRTLRSMRFIARRAQMASVAADIAAPSLCPAGRDMARRLRHQVRSSLGPSSTCESAVLNLRGASAGRAPFFTFNREA